MKEGDGERGKQSALGKTVGCGLFGDHLANMAITHLLEKQVNNLPPNHIKKRKEQADVHLLKRNHGVHITTYLANPFSPYSIQKRPEPQICPKFVPTIDFGGSNRGTEICQTFVKL